MKRKMIALLVTMVLSLSLAGCGDNNSVNLSETAENLESTQPEKTSFVTSEAPEEESEQASETQIEKYSDDFEMLYSIDELKTMEETKELFFTNLCKQDAPKNLLVILFNYENGSIDMPDEELEQIWADYIFGHGTIEGKDATVNDYFREMSNGKCWFNPVLVGDNTTGVYSVHLDKDYSDDQGRHEEYPFFEFNYDFAHVMDELAEKGLEIDRFCTPEIDSENYFETMLDYALMTQEEHKTTWYTSDAVLCIFPTYNFEKVGLTPMSADFNRFGLYAHLNHDSAFGTIAHELGHMLGAIDIYRYGYVENDLMSNGYDADEEYSVSHIDPYYKMIFGWSRVKYASCSGQTVLYPCTSEQYAPVLIPTDDPNQYFLVENRKAGGFDNYIGENDLEGLTVWRVDKLALEKIYNTGGRKGLAMEGVYQVGETIQPEYYSDRENVEIADREETGIEIYYMKDTGDGGAVVKITMP